MAVFCINGASNEGTFVLGGSGWVSGTVNEIMSTMLETSFLIVSGREGGRSLPVIFKLQRYIASANSGKNSFPDLVVSDKTLSCTVSYNYLLSEALGCRVCLPDP